MTKADNRDGEGKQKRGTRFVPLEDVPAPGLSPRAREVVAVALCGFSLYGLLALATFRMRDLDGAIPTEGMQNLGGIVGYYLAGGFACSLGLAGWIPFLLLLAGAMLLLLGRSLERPTIKVIGGVVLAAMMAILFAGTDGAAGISASTPYGAGGAFGKVLSPRLYDALGGPGRLLVVGFGALLALLIATEWMFSQLLLRTMQVIETVWRRLWRRPAAALAGPAADVDEGAAAEPVGVVRRRPARGAAADEADAEVDPANGTVPSKRGARRASREAVALRDDEAAQENTNADEPIGDEAAAAEPEAELENPAEPAARRRRRRRGAGDEADAEAVGADADAAAADADAEPPLPAEPLPPPPPIVVVAPRPKPPKPPKPKKKQSELPFEEYPFPPIELFQEPQHGDLGATSDVLNKGGQAIVQKLANFDIQSEIVAASVGPAVTQYELRLHEGIRVNRVATFESDLAAALKAVSVRVVAPIPGKDTIGIEVPNVERQKVYMRDLLDQFGRSESAAIPLYLGKDVAGNPIVEDMARMPHLLIAGTTGSGKSVCINTILLSILMTRTPEQVKLILVDPKMVELQAYKRVPHLCCDVVTNMKKAPSVLQWAVDEMENRYALLSAAGVNHIRNYNRLGATELEKRLKREPDPERVLLPYIVIVIDEFADLMNVAQNEVEELIQRLAQKSRAVGMHVILATQRPSSEVITGIIKANLPCQIAFKVNRRIDSRVILDANGAEKLLGFGDMLYMPPGGGALIRAQGTFVADDEMQAVVRFLEEHGQEPQFDHALMQTQTGSRKSIADRDERYREAVEIVLGQQRGSATLLQRALAVGYTRATRLLELMEEDGLVGPFVGSKSRDVLMTLDEYHAREEQMEQAMAELEQAEADGETDGETAADAAGGDGGDGGAEPGVSGVAEVAATEAASQAGGDEPAEATEPPPFEVGDGDGRAAGA
ncbi:MAG: DNA translocase FtsK 4TM domain-containing protein [Planctomycetes bacterium]|nr:DNA translocase FtsK 4TM domain-containing protein [Planctomycetota bacterium]